jgi:predicted TPR repeat methyltransferase
MRADPHRRPRLMFAGNTTTKSEMEDFYKVEDPWSFDLNVDDDRRVGRLLGCIPNRKFRRVLDVGCGNGFLTVRLPGDEIHGVEISENAVKWAHARAERVGKNIEFHVGSVFDIEGICPAPFDLIVITGVLYPELIGEAFELVRIKLDGLLEEGGYLVHAHIESWFSQGFPYRLIDRQIYPYREYFHLLEVYKK